MGNILGTGGGGGGKGYGQVGYGPELQCCKGVVDPITLLSVLAGIAAISFVLRQAAINNIKAGRRKKRFVFEKNEIDNFLEGLEGFEKKVEEFSTGTDPNNRWMENYQNSTLGINNETLMQGKIL